MTRVLYATHEAYGYLPWSAAELVASEFGKTMTDIYTTASLLSNFRRALTLGSPARRTALHREPRHRR